MPHFRDQLPNHHRLKDQGPSSAQAKNSANPPAQPVHRVREENPIWKDSQLRTRLSSWHQGHQAIDRPSRNQGGHHNVWICQPLHFQHPHPDFSPNQLGFLQWISIRTRTPSQGNSSRVNHSTHPNQKSHLSSWKKSGSIILSWCSTTRMFHSMWSHFRISWSPITNLTLSAF